MRENSQKHQRTVDAIVISSDNDGTFKYFSGWLKNRDSLPEQLRKELLADGIADGESVPMFSDSPDAALRFVDDGMAKHTAEKIAMTSPAMAANIHATTENLPYSPAGRRMMSLLYVHQPVTPEAEDAPDDSEEPMDLSMEE